MQRLPKPMPRRQFAPLVARDTTAAQCEAMLCILRQIAATPPPPLPPAAHAPRPSECEAV